MQYLNPILFNIQDVNIYERKNKLVKLINHLTALKFQHIKATGLKGCNFQLDLEIKKYEEMIENTTDQIDVLEEGQFNMGL